MARLVTRKGRLKAAETSGKAFYRGGYGAVYRDDGRHAPAFPATTRQAGTPIAGLATKTTRATVETVAL